MKSPPFGIVVAVAVVLVAGAYWIGTRSPAVPAEPYVKLPPEVQAKPGIPVLIRAETNCKVVHWEYVDRGLEEWPVGPTVPFATFVYASSPGRYRVQAIAAKGDVPTGIATCFVVVGGPGPVPPGPVPPGPNPPPPDDPLAKSVAYAYGLETEPDKASSKSSFAALYRQAAASMGNPSLATWGDVFDVMKAAADQMGIRGKLFKVQGQVQDHLKRTLPTSRTAPLDAPGRDLAARTFNHVAQALESVR